MSNATQSPFPGPETQQQPQKSGSGNGCLWGCLIAVGVVIAICVCMGVGTYFMFTSTLNAYTSETPMELQTVEYDEQQMEQLNGRIKSFSDALEAGDIPEEDLILSAEEINALIADKEELRGRVFVQIEEGQVKGDISFPMNMIPGGKGRYLNGSGTFDVSMENGVLIVTADQMEVNGDPIPEAFMEGMRRENLAKEVYKKPENAKFIRKFESIEVQDDKIIMRVKRDAATDDSAEDAPASETATEESGLNGEETLTQPSTPE